MWKIIVIITPYLLIFSISRHALFTARSESIQKFADYSIFFWKTAQNTYDRFLRNIFEYTRWLVIWHMVDKILYRFKGMTFIQMFKLLNYSMENERSVISVSRKLGEFDGSRNLSSEKTFGWIIKKM